MAETKNINTTTTNNNNINTTPLTSPDFIKHSLESTTTSGEKPKRDEPDTIQASKRQKKSPKALDQVQAACCFVPSNQSNSSSSPSSPPSFTFDTKFISGCCCPPDSTPKFGSFNFAASASSSGELQNCCDKNSTLNKQESEENKEDGDNELRVVVDEIIQVDEK